MNQYNYLILTLLLVFASFPVLAETPAIQGNNVRVVDGDTLEINNNKIRIQGIDAPETAQICGQAGKSVHCGQLATYELENLIQDQEVKCLNLGNDKYGRIIGECYLGNLEINEWMVKNGWALAYRKYSTKYVDAEAYAKDKGLGIWAMEFIEPWNWRSVKKSLQSSPQKKEPMPNKSSAARTAIIPQKDTEGFLTENALAKGSIEKTANGIKELSKGQPVTITGISDDKKWYEIKDANGSIKLYIPTSSIAVFSN